MDSILNVTIEKLDHFGRGIVRDEKHGLIFVENALPGDVVDIVITREKKGFREAIVSEYYERSTHFRSSICPYSDVCGGCDFINLLYEEQIKYKEQKVQELIDRILKEKVELNEVLFSNHDFYYRNKILLHGNGRDFGLYRKQSNELVTIDKCALVNPRINDIIVRLRSYFEKSQDVIRDITIKTTSLAEDMISIHGRIDHEAFKKEFADVRVIIINDRVITNNGYIKEKLLGAEFYISNQSFFQVNMYNTKLLYQKIIDLVKRRKYDSCLDLYCGTGTISLLLSDYVGKVYGVECVKDAIDDAIKNKELNGKDNVEFILGRVDENIDGFSSIELVVVDPPREGLDQKTRKTLLMISPSTIIYVSCDPVTLMRDLNEFKREYDIKEIDICDMFPNTNHVECICLLNKKCG